MDTDKKKMAVRRCVEMLNRVARDLVQFQDGRGIPLATLESFSVVLELAYRELLVMDLMQQLNNEQKDAIDIVCHCLACQKPVQILSTFPVPRSVVSVTCVHRHGW